MSGVEMIEYLDEDAIEVENIIRSELLSKIKPARTLKKRNKSDNDPDYEPNLKRCRRRAAIKHEKVDEKPKRRRPAPSVHNKTIPDAMYYTIPVRYYHQSSGKTGTILRSGKSIRGGKGSTQSKTKNAVSPSCSEENGARPYILRNAMKKPDKLTRLEVAVTSEKYEDDYTLVAYEPKESLVMVFQIMEEDDPSSPEEGAKYLQEMAYFTACTQCVLTSWCKKMPEYTGPPVPAYCPLCAYVCYSGATMLRHFSTHPPKYHQVFREELNEVLSKLTPFRYKCHVCLQQMTSILKLREHMYMHRDLGKFECKVGDHLVLP